MAFILGRMTYSSFYVTAFLTTARSAFLSEEVGLWENLHLYHDELVGSFVWWSRRSGEETPG